MRYPKRLILPIKEIRRLGFYEEFCLQEGFAVETVDYHATDDMIFSFNSSLLPKGYKYEVPEGYVVKGINDEEYTKEKIIRDHKVKSEQVKELKNKLKNRIPISVIEEKLSREKSREIDYREYYSWGEFNQRGYDSAVVERDVRITLLEEILYETER